MRSTPSIARASTRWWGWRFIEASSRPSQNFTGGRERGRNSNGKKSQIRPSVLPSSFDDLALVKILLAGGSGFLGRPLSSELAARGHEVVILARGAPRQNAIGRWVQWQPDGAADVAW